MEKLKNSQAAVAPVRASVTPLLSAVLPEGTSALSSDHHTQKRPASSPLYGRTQGWSPRESPTVRPDFSHQDPGAPALPPSLPGPPRPWPRARTPEARAVSCWQTAIRAGEAVWGPRGNHPMQEARREETGTRIESLD